MARRPARRTVRSGDRSDQEEQQRHEQEELGDVLIGPSKEPDLDVPAERRCAERRDDRDPRTEGLRREEGHEGDQGEPQHDRHRRGGEGDGSVGRAAATRDPARGREERVEAVVARAPPRRPVR